MFRDYVNPVWSAVLLVCTVGLCSCMEEAAAVKTAPPLRCGDSVQMHTGRATFYTTANGSGNCSFDPTPDNLMVVALNTTDYAGSSLCGASIKVMGPKGQTVVRVVDRCGGCQAGDIDLSPEAFALIGDPSLGSVPVTWQIVPGDVDGPIVYHFNSESNQWWTAVQLRNVRFPVTTFEYRTTGGAFKPVERVNYNYFVESAGMGPGPLTFRVTDLYGHVLTDSLIVPAPGVDVPGRNQFPLCTP